MTAVNLTETVPKTTELTTKMKFAFFNLLPCTSMVPQDFHNLESSEQIICFIIQSKIVKYLHSLYSQVEKNKRQKSTLFTNVKFKHFSLSNLFSFSFSYKVKIPLGIW